MIKHGARRDAVHRRYCPASKAGAKSVSFGPAKFRDARLAQSLARDLGPREFMSRGFQC